MLRLLKILRLKMCRTLVGEKVVQSTITLMCLDMNENTLTHLHVHTECEQCHLVMTHVNIYANENVINSALNVTSYDSRSINAAIVNKVVAR